MPAFVEIQSGEGEMSILRISQDGKYYIEKALGLGGKSSKKRKREAKTKKKLPPRKVNGEFRKRR